MVKNFLFVSIGLLLGCATPESTIHEIVISNSGFILDGELYYSEEDLTTALLSKGVKHLHFLPQKDAPYTKVAAAMLAAQKVGADVGLVGNERGE